AQKNLQNNALEAVMGFALLLSKRTAEADKTHAVELLSFVKSNPHNSKNFGAEMNTTGLYDVGEPYWERMQTELPTEVFNAAVERSKALNFDAVVAEFATAK